MNFRLDKMLRKLKASCVLLILGAVVAAGCAPQEQAPRDTTTVSAPALPPSVTSTTSLAATLEPSPTYTDILSPTVSPTAVASAIATTSTSKIIVSTPEAPQLPGLPQSLLDRMKTDLAQRLSIGIEAIELVLAESVMWRDGSLGCPEPGQTYLQAITPGFRVILKANGQEYDYRASEQGFFKLCV